jgi:hypothetical protein
VPSVRSTASRCPACSWPACSPSAVAANVVVFSLVNGLFLRPFPFPGADRLVYVNERAPRRDLENTGINFPDHAAWRSSVRTFDGIALYSVAAFTMSDGTGAERVDGARALSVAVALLLVVACASVAAVMLARAIARRREMGIRLAVGASRGRLMQQLLTENVLLAVAGGLLGLALGQWLLRLLVAAAGDQLPAWAVFEPDVRLVGFAVLITLGTALLFEWAPALHAVRGDLRSTMNDSVSGSTSSPSGARTLSWLVGVEFAMAAVLLVSAGLFVRAFDQVRRIDPGFHTSNVLTFSVGLPPAAYRDTPARLAFWNRSLERMRALPVLPPAPLPTTGPASRTGCADARRSRCACDPGVSRPPRSAAPQQRPFSECSTRRVAIVLSICRVSQARSRRPGHANPGDSGQTNGPTRCGGGPQAARPLDGAAGSRDDRHECLGPCDTSPGARAPSRCSP